YAQGAIGDFMNAVAEGRVPAGSVLIVESLDRLSREPVEVAALRFLTLINSGIDVATLHNQKVYKKGITLVEILAAVLEMERSHQESAIKSERVGRAWRKKQVEAKSAVVTAQVPAWLRAQKQYMPGDGLSPAKMITTLSVDPERAKVVREIFEQSANGVGAFTIVRRLNSTQVPPFGRRPRRKLPDGTFVDRKGKAGWQTSYIAKLLTNRAVLGEYQ